VVPKIPKWLLPLVIDCNTCYIYVGTGITKRKDTHEALQDDDGN